MQTAQTGISPANELVKSKLARSSTGETDCAMASNPKVPANKI